MSSLIHISKSNIPFLASEELGDIGFAALTSWQYDFNQITDYINSKNIYLSPGDILCFAPPQHIYRNGSKCIWYGESAHALAHDIDEYGALPNVEELQLCPGRNFHPRYWSENITHNGFYWICDEYRNQCVDNIDVKVDNQGNKIFFTWFIHNNTKEYLVFNPDFTDEQKHELDIIIKEKFIKKIQDKSIPYDWTYSEYCDIYVDLMDECNTSILNGDLEV